MYRASAGVLLPTSIIGSLPRSAWHTVQLGARAVRGCGVDASARTAVTWTWSRDKFEALSAIRQPRIFAHYRGGQWRKVYALSHQD